LKASLLLIYNTMKLFLSILLLFTFTTFAFTCTIHIAGSLSLSGRFRVVGTPLYNGFSFWAEEVNARGGLEINGTFCHVNLTIWDDESEEEVLIQNYDTLSKDPNVHLLLAPVGSSFLAIASEKAMENKKLLISATRVRGSFLNGYLLSTAAYDYGFQVLVPYLRIHDVKTVTLLGETFEGSLCEIVEEQAKDLSINITKVHAARFPRENNSSAPFEDWDPVLSQNFSVVAEEIVEADSDALIHCLTFPRSKNFIMQLMRDVHGYTPKMFAGLGSILDVLDQEFLPFQVILNDYSPYLTPDATLLYDKNLIQLQDQYSERFEMELEGYAANAIITGQVIGHIFVDSDSWETQALIDSFLRVKFDSYMGRISFDGAKRQQREYIMQQYQAEYQDGTEIIAPVSAQTEAFIYPIPKWEERYQEEFGDDAAELVLIVFIILFMILSLGFIVALIPFWNHKAIKAASPPFILFILLGSLVLYASAFTFLPHLITDFGCNIRAWLMGLGWVMIYGSLFARTWRLKILFNINSFQRVKISDKRLWTIIGVLLVTEAVLLAIFQGVVRMERVVEQPDPFRRSKDYIRCAATYGNWATYIPIFFIGIFDGVIVIYGLYLSICVRKIRYSVFNETKILIFSLYNLAFFAFIVVLFQSNAIWVEHRAKYIASIVFLVLGVGSTIIALMGQKYHFLRIDKDTMATRAKSNEVKSTKLSDEVERLEKELRKANAEIAKWKKKATKLRVSTQQSGSDSMDSVSL